MDFLLNTLYPVFVKLTLIYIRNQVCLRLAYGFVWREVFNSLGVKFINNKDYIIDFQFELLVFDCKAMKKDGSSRMNAVSYLDVSEYIIKEPSPLLKPSSPQDYHHEVHFFDMMIQLYLSDWLLLLFTNQPQYLELCIVFLDHYLIMQCLLEEDSYSIEDIQPTGTEMVLTPITKNLIRMEVQDIMDDFMLESQDHLLNNEQLEKRRRKQEKYRSKKQLNFELFKLDNDLDSIVQYDHEQSQLSQPYSEYHEPLSKPQDQCGANSNTFCTLWAKKTQAKDSISKDIEIQNQTTIDASIIDYTQNIQTFSKNPKLEILNKINQIEQISHDYDHQEKKILLKKYLESYLLQYETYCYQEAWKDVEASFASNEFSIIKQGIEETFNKKIGTLPFEQRRVKLLKYLEKKRRRIWRKKVSYDCRKKVADGRLRIKGKFVTREQACEQLGLESLDNYSAEEIKEMLQRRIDDNLRQSAC